jgi:hypothetical protein
MYQIYEKGDAMHNIGLTNRVDITKIDDFKTSKLGGNRYEIIPFNTFETVGQLLGYMGLRRNDYDIYHVITQHQPGETVKAINIGDSRIADYNDIEYGLDYDYVYGDGERYLLRVDVLDTEEDRLYHYGRWGHDFGFKIDLDPDIYYVTLHFSEPWYDQVGIRLFDVIMNKEIKIENLDLALETKNLYDRCDISLAAGRRRALELRRVVPARNGKLDIRLKSRRLDAIISGIRVERIIINATEKLQEADIHDAVHRKDRILFWNKGLVASEEEMLKKYREISGLPSDPLFNKSLL